MIVTRHQDAQPYEAPGHTHMEGFRLQGGPVSDFGAVVGLSVFQPGGGAELSSSGKARVYVVTSGELTVTVDGQAHVLKAYDSCCIPAGESRSIVNAAQVPATIITIIANTPA